MMFEEVMIQEAIIQESVLQSFKHSKSQRGPGKPPEFSPGESRNATPGALRKLHDQLAEATQGTQALLPPTPVQHTSAKPRHLLPVPVFTAYT